MPRDAEIHVAGKWKVVKRLGLGSFGEVYEGEDLMTSESVALKLEELGVRHPQLYAEVQTYKELAGGDGIPNVRWHGREGDYNVMAMDILGPSLEDCFDCCQRKFTLKTTLLIADQLMKRIEYVHERGFVHRDVKPDNFLIGVQGEASKIYIVDFGLAERYCDRRGKHCEYSEHGATVGTSRYSSIAANMGICPSRRDDMESLGYVLVYFLRGSLPWQGLRAKKSEKNERVLEKKMEVPVETLCEDLPQEFADYLTYCRKLKFEEKPNYEAWRKKFRDLFVKMKYADDQVFDWSALAEAAAPL